MASITKRGPHLCRVRIHRKGYPVQTKTFDTKADAEQWVLEIESEMDRGKSVSRAEGTTLHEALERFIEEYIPGLAHQDKETRRARGLQRRTLVRNTLASIRIKDIADFIRRNILPAISSPSSARTSNATPHPRLADAGRMIVYNCGYTPGFSPAHLHCTFLVY